MNNTQTIAASQEKILELANQLAKEFSKTAAKRDREGGTPLHERNLLRKSGLLALPIPKEYGGYGASWPIVFKVVNIIAKADSSLAHLLGYHYLTVCSTFLFGSIEQYKTFYKETAAHQLFWGNAFNPRDSGLKAVRENGRLMLSGSKSFCSGATDSDRLLVSAQEEGSGEVLLCVLPTHRAGIVTEDNWDGFGQRQTDSGSVKFEDVIVYEEEMLRKAAEEQKVFPTVRTHLAQLMLTHLLYGIAQGALEESKVYVKAHTKPWISSDVEAAEQDPYIIQQYGEMSLNLHACSALIEKAVAEFDHAWKKEDVLTKQQRGESGVAIALAKTFTVKTVLHITSTIFDGMGARATSDQYKFDRYWRNARTISLHDPIAYKLRDIGKWCLSSELPPITPYS
ncbi:dibenzothiophene monooxygenase [Bacillus sp. AG236]|nr:dibenzothiophene monooxygenase [Bacillus sp. AG236]